MRIKQQRSHCKVRSTSILITLSVTLLFSNSQKALAQHWEPNGNNINNTNTGNVGIGTTTPGALLEVNKSQNAGTTITLDNGYTAAGNAAYSGFFFKQGGSNRFFFGAINAGNTAQSGGPGGVQLWNFANGPMLFATNSVERLRIDANGNVGIGTTNPLTSLQIGNPTGVPTASPVTLSLGGTYSSSAGANLKLRLYEDGNAANTYGIGVSPSSMDFGVGPAGSYNWYAGGANKQMVLTTSPFTSLQIGYPTSVSVAGPVTLSLGGTYSSSAGANLKLRLYEDGNAANTYGIGVSSLSMDFGVGPSGGYNWYAGGANKMVLTSGGNVGIGTSTPAYKLDVAGTIRSSSGGFVFPDGTVQITAGGGGSQWTTAGTNIVYNAGNVGLGTTTPTSKLHVTGDGKFTGNLIVDGNIAAKYQDVAEWVPAKEQLSAGTVVVVDTTKPNQVISSSLSYDTRVAGVISEQPGITLGEKSDNKVLVATTGRVRVKVDATTGPIQIGDLLVTSNREGFAMKSLPLEIGASRIHRTGTLIGKALEPLDKGTGEILVLLSLQ